MPQCRGEEARTASLLLRHDIACIFSTCELQTWVKEELQLQLQPIGGTLCLLLGDAFAQILPFIQQASKLETCTYYSTGEPSPRITTISRACPGCWSNRAQMQLAPATQSVVVLTKAEKVDILLETKQEPQLPSLLIMPNLNDGPIYHPRRPRQLHK